MGLNLLQSPFLGGVGQTRRNAVMGTVALILNTACNVALLEAFGAQGMGWSRLVPGLVWAVGLVTMRNSFFPELPRARFVSGSFGAASAILLLFVVVLPMTHFIDQID